ncbi:hypothetical protein D9M72_367720 [compost metagenome]
MSGLLFFSSRGVSGPRPLAARTTPASSASAVEIQSSALKSDVFDCRIALRTGGT